MSTIKLKRYNLIGGENTYASPATTGPNDARKLQSLIPSLAGYLERERPTIAFTGDSSFPSRVGFFHQFKRHNEDKTLTTHYFCATATTLYKLQNPGPSQTWAAVTQIGTLAGFPVAVNNNNQMHLSDDAKNWIFDGQSWIKDGLEIPLHPPAFAVVAGAGFAVTANRYYWTTFSDQSVTHPHESSSSPISPGTGPFTGTANVQPRKGTINVAGGSSAVVGNGTDFTQDDIGQYLFLNDVFIALPVPHFFVSPFLITAVQDAQHLTISGSPITTTSGASYIIAPARTTHWNLYASSSEEDKRGNFLASIAIQGSAGLQATYLDQSPMIGTIGSIFSSVERPLLNDPPQPTRIMEVHKNRIFRRVEDFPNIFSFTGFEEILAEQVGSPSECVPGADPNTRSPDDVNEDSLPDQAVHIRGLCKHGDALYIGSESNVIPLFGNQLSNFALSEAPAFVVGFAGQRSNKSTPFGLAFVSYDHEVYLYPSQSAYNVDLTTALVELGRPKRPEFELMDGTDFENVHLVPYFWGRRKWLVLSYRRANQTFATWAFDFEIKGWFQLQQGYTSVAVFEMTPGRKTLIGASAADNRVYVIDDLTGNFPVPDGQIYPVGYFRQLIDFGKPDSTFVVRSLGYEKSNADMEVDVTVWLDPKDPDNPGPGITVVMSNSKLGANTLTGSPISGGSSCQRMLVEFAVTASTKNGKFLGFSVEAEELKATPAL